MREKGYSYWQCPSVVSWTTHAPFAKLFRFLDILLNVTYLPAISNKIKSFSVARGRPADLGCELDDGDAQGLTLHTVAVGHSYPRFGENPAKGMTDRCKDMPFDRLSIKDQLAATEEGETTLKRLCKRFLLTRQRG